MAETESPGLANDGFIWTIGRKGTATHKADPNHPTKSLCGVNAEYMAPQDVLDEPALRCYRCVSIDKRSQQ